MNHLPSFHRRPRRSESGFTIVELLIATFVGTLIMGATMTALSDALRANDAVLRLTSMNTTLRTAMDLMVRDFLQVGSGLPPGHVVLTPSGAGSTLIRIPGPPGSAFTNVAGDTDMPAVVPGAGRGPVINGVATDTVTVLTADNTFSDIALTAVSSTSVTVTNAVNIGAGPNRVIAGQVMMITKGSFSTLVQVTFVSASTRVLTFAAADSLNLNQPAAVKGNLAALNAAAPANTPASTKITRVRMISYYIDTMTTTRPRLMRRINNGHPTSFNNELGTAVGMDIENLQITFDIADGATNPAHVRFTAADLNGTGACAPNPCAETQIRKMNLAITGRSGNPGNARVFRNTLTSQVSLRGMAFLNEYQAP